MKPSILDVTICPPDWNARKPNGISSLKLISRFCTARRPIGSGITCDWTKAAAMMMQMLCRKKDIPRVPRAFGLMWRELAKKRHPHRNAQIETRDFNQP